MTAAPSRFRPAKPRVCPGSTASPVATTTSRMPDTTLTHLAGCCVTTAQPPWGRASTRRTTPAATARTGSSSRANSSIPSRRSSVPVGESRRIPGTPTSAPRTGRAKRRRASPVSAGASACWLRARSSATCSARTRPSSSARMRVSASPLPSEASARSVASASSNRDFGLLTEAQLATACQAVGQESLLAQLGFRPIRWPSRTSSRVARRWARLAPSSTGPATRARLVPAETARLGIYPSTKPRTGVER